MEFIRDGESYEICLTNRLTADNAVCPLQYYRGLRDQPGAAILPPLSGSFGSMLVAGEVFKIDPQGAANPDRSGHAKTHGKCG
jgi:hypothetical protein